MSRTKKWGWTIGMTIVTILLSFLQWHYPLPIGYISVGIAGIVILVAFFAVSIMSSLVTMLVAAIITVLIGETSWAFWLPILVVVAVLSAVVGWRMSLTVHMSVNQAITFSFIAGIAQMVGEVIVLCIKTLMITGAFRDMPTVIKIGGPAVILEGLLYVLILPGLILLTRHFTEHDIEA